MWRVERDIGGCFRGNAPELCGRLSGLLQTESAQNRMDRESGEYVIFAELE